jgi:transposase
MSVILERDGADLARTRRLGLARFEVAVRREIARRGGRRPCLRIVRLLFAALADPAGVLAHRPGALERVQLLLQDWRETRPRLAETEARMIAVLDELHLTELATSITGLSALGAAAILAETGDLTRFATARAVVKHAGLAPREAVRHVCWPHETHRPRPPGAAPGGVAGGLGSPTDQPGL